LVRDILSTEELMFAGVGFVTGVTAGGGGRPSYGAVRRDGPHQVVTRRVCMARVAVPRRNSCSFEAQQVQVRREWGQRVPSLTARYSRARRPSSRLNGPVTPRTLLGPGRRTFPAIRSDEPLARPRVAGQ